MAIFLAGLLAGGYLFRDTQPRSFLNFDDCGQGCLGPKEFLGLLGSAGVQQTPDLIPFVVAETDKTIVIEAPFPKASIHYVIIPKKDIKDIADISDEDREYLIDAFAVLGGIIRDKNLTYYKLYTNGPRYQTVNYLHFHLLAD